jgi:hypothetical protein
MSDAGQLRRFFEELERITGWAAKDPKAAEEKLETMAREAAQS